MKADNSFNCIDKKGCVSDKLRREYLDVRTTDLSDMSQVTCLGDMQDDDEFHQKEEKIENCFLLGL